MTAQPHRLEIAATGHLVAVETNRDPVCCWSVTISANEGDRHEVASVSELQPADLLVDDLLEALEYVAENPVR